MSIFEHPYPHTQNGHPSLVELELTSICNANCIFCPRYLFKHPKMMNKKVFDQVLFRFKESNIECVKLAGMGEPTLHPELLGIISQLHNNGFTILLNTNGSLLHKYNVDKLLSLCDEVIISFHSLNYEIHKKIFGIDFYNKVLQNIEYLIKVNEHYSRTITLYIVLTTLNRNADCEIQQLWGAHIKTRTSGCTNRTVENFVENISDDAINRQYNHYPKASVINPICGYAEAALAIDSQGKYLLCTNDVKRNTGLNNVWDNPIEKAFSDICYGFNNGCFIEHCKQCDNYIQQDKR